MKASFKVRDSFGATTDTIRVFAGVGGPDAPKVGILNSAANPVALTYNAEKNLWEGLFTSKNAPDKIGVLKAHWNWQANNATKDPTKWKEAGTSHHHIFISNKQPLGKPYVWVAWWACEWAAGKNGDSDILNAMFDKLAETASTGPKVDLDYVFPGFGLRTTEALLSTPTRKGTCGHWQAFFDDLAKVHGITILRVSGAPVPEEKPDAPIRYVPGTNQTSTLKGGDLWWYVYQKALQLGWILGEPAPQPFPSPGPFGWKTSETDIDGDLGPFNGSWEFSDHGWCLWEGTAPGPEDDIVYDPSFGKKTTADEWPGHTAGAAHIRKLFSHYGKLLDIGIGSKPVVVQGQEGWRELTHGTRTLGAWTEKDAFANGTIRIVGKRYDEAEEDLGLPDFEVFYPPWD